MSRVLLIDSDPADAELIRTALTEQGHVVRVAANGSDGLAATLEKTPSLVLLALNLPDQSGLDVFRTMHGRARTEHIPVMFLAERGEASQQNEVLYAGADDFIIKPFDTDILSLRVRNAIKRAERDGLHHPQTGLPTGRLIQERVRALAEEYGWYKIDFILDHFAAFREAYGFMTGQEVMTFAAELIGDGVRTVGTPEDFIGHRADDEFTIVTRLANGPALKAQLETRFNGDVLTFYNFAEREQGYIELIDASGEQTQHPLMRARIKVQQGEAE
ncbi:MAG: response regulator [Aggregatilineales bacterium]